MFPFYSNSIFLNFIKKNWFLLIIPFCLILNGPKSNLNILILAGALSGIVFFVVLFSSKIILIKNNLFFWLFTFFLCLVVNFLIRDFYYTGLIATLRILCLIVFLYLLNNFIKERNIIKIFIFFVLTILIFEFFFYIYPVRGKLLLISGNPNYTGLLLASASILNIGLIHHYKQNGKNLMSTFFIICYLILFFCLIFTKSRASLLNFFASLISVLYYQNKLFKNKSLLLLIAAVIYFFISIKPDFYFSGRISIYLTALEIIKNNFFIGIGAGRFHEGYLLYQKPFYTGISYYGHITQFAHNEYLQIFSEYGIFALIFFFIVIINIFKFKPQNFIQIIIKSSLLGIFFQIFFDFSLFPLINWFLIILLIHLLYFKDVAYSFKLKKTLKIPIVFFIFMIIFIISYLSYAEFLGNRVNSYSIEKSVMLNPYNSNAIKKFIEIKKNIILNFDVDEISKDIKRYNWDYECYLALADFWSELYRKILKNPDEGDFGVQYYFNKSIFFYKEILDKNPYNVFIYTNLGILLAENGFLYNAMENFKKAISYEPNYIPAYVLIMNCYKKLNLTTMVDKKKTQIDILKKSLVRKIEKIKKIRNITPYELKILGVKSPQELLQ